MTDAFAQLAQMTQVLEDVLAQRYYATGRGLQEKLSSVENELPDAARKQIRLVASFRDRAADGAGAALGRRGGVCAARNIARRLNRPLSSAFRRLRFGASVSRRRGA